MENVCDAANRVNEVVGFRNGVEDGFMFVVMMRVIGLIIGLLIKGVKVEEQV
ncbi:hypothetical protein [Bacillus sp. WP8]|uniref:hypothetical protein n=1 Tax=Bacillus sp. WP8 TaxID=756828 RepID=UPI001642D6E5|nr:hypothetical protein [Bacillus sp. WP8]